MGYRRQQQLWLTARSMVDSLCTSSFASCLRFPARNMVGSLWTRLPLAFDFIARNLVETLCTGCRRAFIALYSYRASDIFDTAYTTPNCSIALRIITEFMEKNT